MVHNNKDYLTRIMSVDPQTQDIQRDLLIEHVDVPERVVQYDDEIQLPTPLVSSIRDGREHDIKSFVKRPIVVNNGLWSSTSGVNVNLATLTLPNNYLLHPMVYQKIKGFLTFKGTAIVTITLNATRFQQGRLICSFFPQANIPVSNNRYFDATGFIPLRTMLPRIELDASSDTQVTFKIPYHTTELAFNMLSGEGSQGNLDLAVYSPLVIGTGGTDGAEFSILVSYEDVEITFPTAPGGFQAQGITEVKRRGNGKNPSDQETEEYGPLSGAFTSLGKASGYLAKIPLLSTVCEPTAWFFNAIGQGAKAFGWSKPLALQELTATIPRPFLKITNGTGKDFSNNLAIYEDNSVALLPSLGPTSEDECSIPFICSKKMFLGGVQITSAQDVGTTVIDYRVGLGTFNTVLLTTATIANQTGQQIKAMLPCDYIGQHFRFYKSSFDVSLKFVKTEFHSGRLLVTFQPGASNTAFMPATLENSYYTYREIVDLRYTVEHKFTIPWISTSPFLPFGIPFGNLRIFILNELRAPPTVSSSITMLIEFAAHPDIELAGPTSPVYLPFPTLNTKATSAGGGITFINDTYTPQAGEVITKPDDGKPQPMEMHGFIGNARSPGDNDFSGLYAIGESVKSISLLVKRPAMQMIAPNPGTSPVFYFTPEYNYYAYASASAGDLLVGTGYDYINCFAPMYMYSRGSYRYKIVDLANTTPSIAYRVSANQAIFGMIPSTNIVPQGQSATGYFQGSISLAPPAMSLPIGESISLGGEIQVPMYHRTFAKINSYVNAIQPTPITSHNPYYQGNTYVYIIAQNSSSTGTNNLPTIGLMRSGGEDFQFGYWLGTPPVVASVSILSTPLTPSVPVA